MAELFTLPEGFLFQLSAKEPGALEKLIRSYYAILCRFAEKFLPDRALAEDVVQETFIKFWKLEKSFDSMQGLKAYLFAMTRNGCLDLLRSRSSFDNKHRQAAAFMEDSVESVLPAITHAEFVAQIYQVVKAMPEKMQQIFFLSYRDGMKVSEIAVQLGMDLKAVKKQKYKALATLRGRFSNRHASLMMALSSAALMADQRL